MARRDGGGSMETRKTNVQSSVIVADGDDFYMLSSTKALIWARSSVLTLSGTVARACGLTSLMISSTDWAESLELILSLV